MPGSERAGGIWDERLPSGVGNGGTLGGILDDFGGVVPILNAAGTVADQMPEVVVTARRPWWLRAADFLGRVASDVLRPNTAICIFDGNCSGKQFARSAAMSVFEAATMGAGLTLRAGAQVVARGTGKLGGVITSTTNSAGGTVVTASGRVVGSDFAGAVNSGLLRGGPVHILSGAHGEVTGVMRAERAFFDAHIEMFGHLDGVNVFDVSRMSSGEISRLLQGPGTTIGAFCDSGACLAPFR